MSDTPKKRSITLNGHRTSISIEDAFWISLGEIAAEKKLSISQLVEKIDHGRNNAGLSSSLRLYVLQDRNNKISELALKRR